MGADSPIGSRQLRAAAPRHGARRRRRSSSTRCTCTSPTSSKSTDKPPEWMTKTDGGWKKQNAKARHGGAARRADRGRRADRPRRPGGPGGVLEGRSSTSSSSRTASCSSACPTRRSTSSTAPRAAGSATRPRINDLIDSNQDGKLSRQEISNFYAGGGGAAGPLDGDVPRLGVDQRAELGRRAARPEGLQDPQARRDRPADRRSDHARPVVGRRRSPSTRSSRPTARSITTTRSFFLGWFNQQLLDAAALAGPGASEKDAKDIPPDLLDDFGVAVTPTARRCARAPTSPRTRATSSSACRSCRRATTRRSAAHNEPPRPPRRRRTPWPLAPADPARVRGDAGRRGRRPRLAGRGARSPGRADRADRACAAAPVDRPLLGPRSPNRVMCAA